MCGKLDKAQQGTRDAAQCWEYEYNTFMVTDLGFTRGVCSPCVFDHKQEDIRAVIHGDYFTLLVPMQAWTAFVQKYRQNGKSRSKDALALILRTLRLHMC